MVGSKRSTGDTWLCLRGLRLAAGMEYDDGPKGNDQTPRLSFQTYFTSPGLLVSHKLITTPYEKSAVAPRLKTRLFASTSRIETGFTSGSLFPG